MYREIARQTRRIQETAESVVPDTNDDIGRIASVQTAVLLKSKDVTSRGVMVTGELTAALIYITESERGVSYVRLSKAFTMEFDTGEIDADALAQVNLSIQNSEARILNPRKVSVTFELLGEMSCFRQDNVITETVLPAASPEGLHAKCEKTEFVAANTVTEKTFAVNEQFIFPSGKPKPSQLVSQCVEEKFCCSGIIIVHRHCRRRDNAQLPAFAIFEFFPGVSVKRTHGYKRQWNSGRTLFFYVFFCRHIICCCSNCCSKLAHSPAFGQKLFAVMLTQERIYCILSLR